MEGSGTTLMLPFTRTLAPSVGSVLKSGLNEVLGGMVPPVRVIVNPSADTPLLLKMPPFGVPPMAAVSINSLRSTS